MGFIEDSHRIYASLQDDISKEIFMARINASITGNWEYITCLPAQYRNLSADTETFYEQLSNQRYKRNVIFGAGANGRNLALGFPKLKTFAFIDNYKTEKMDIGTGVPIYSLDKYISTFGTMSTRFIVSVASRSVATAMYNQLIKKEVSKENILITVADWRNNYSQYFDFFAPRDHETFVDCGCYDGGTAFRFVGWCGQLGYNKIWSFEPDDASYARCKESLSGLKNCEIYPYGVSNTNGTVSFVGMGNEEAKIVACDGAMPQPNLQTIETIYLDDFLKNQRVTFIKMDIEGAEYDAIEGSKEIIKEQKPRLAISVYHNVYHILDIPKLLLELRPDYKFWIRQYSLLTNETILYAE